MKERIFYGLAGEGLGHASRTLAILDQLSDYEVHLFTFGKAYEFLKKMNYPHLHEIYGIMFPFQNNKINYCQLTYDSINFYFNDLKRNMLYISNCVKELQPVLFISDFEPSIPRVAKKFNSKIISIDNQHRFAYIDLIELPFFLRMYGWVCGAAAKFMVPNPDYTIISTFHYDHIKAKGQNVHLTNGLFRNNILEQSTTQGDYLLVYLRESVNDVFLNAIKDIKTEVRIYGGKDNGKLGKDNGKLGDNFKFFPLSSEFVKDLAGCNRLIATAGNQLISEARKLNKFCLLVPEPKQYEQYINAYYAQKIGMAITCKTSELDCNIVNFFMQMSFPNFGPSLPNGVDEAIKIIRNCLNGN